MLSAFTARPIVELKQRDKSKIESILAYGDRVLVGLNTGSLRIYRVNEPTTDGTPAPTGQDGEGDESQPTQPKARIVDLLREEEKFSRRPVHQLAIIKESNILVSLSDNYVSIHDLQTYALQERLERTKGATSFAVTSNIVKDSSTSIPSIVTRLAVAVKRKIVLWMWQDMELSSETTEITLVASVKSLTWASGTKIVAGMDPGFILVDVTTQEITDINKPSTDAGGQTGVRFAAVNSSGMGYMGMGSWVPKPMATKLSEGQLLLAKDVNTLFIDTNGKPIEKRQVPWALAPEAIGYSYPYMLALQAPSRGGLEVRNPDTLSLLQTIPLPNASSLHVPQPNISLAHAGKGFLVSSDRVIWRMEALDYDSQIVALVEKYRFDEAISLLNMLEDTLLKDKEGQIREIKILKAESLFDLRRYRDALDLFSEASAPPERVIARYPKSIAGDISRFESAKDSESDVEQEEPSGATTTNSSKTAVNTSNAGSTLGRSMFGKLRAEHKRVESDAASVRSVKGHSSDAGSERGKSGHTDPAQDKPLEGKDLVLAVNELRGFLVQTRTRIQKFLNFDLTLKDPLKPGDIGQGDTPMPPFHTFIQPPEPGESIDWAEKLREVAKLVDTVLFRAYMMTSPSLAGSLFRLDNFCDPDVVEEKLYESGRYADLIDFLHGKKLHKQALELLEKFGKNEADEEVMPALRGPQRTVGYLQQLPPELIDIILEYADWPLRTDPDLGMEIFLADTENAETLPRDRVLEFLQRIDMKLAVRYLEHIVTELNDLTPDFHQRLIDLYLERLKAEEQGHKTGGFTDDNDRQHWREKLQDFLKSSGQYNKARVFRQLPSDDPDFFESRAIVLSSMGQHKQALQIYVFQLRDYAKAEEYCNATYRAAATTLITTASQPVPTDPSNTETSSIYHTLLSLYLSPPPPNQPNWPPALDLLSRHGARLPASSTLDLIPADLAVKELESYFRGRLRAENEAMRLESVCVGLRGVEKVGVEAELLLGKSGRGRKVVITEDRHCAVCHKRFGGSAIRVYPDGGVVHYGCFGRGRAGTGVATAWG